VKRIVILGGGTGGTITANQLRRIYGSGEAEIVVVDQYDDHVYQPGLLFVPFRLAEPSRLVRPRHRQLHPRDLVPPGRDRPCRPGRRPGPP
jgi:sulfide:quinone oxidoreductase